jgi:hypothetical protein
MANNNQIQVDTIYQEKYQEMRRYRDYELTSSTWYTAFLIAILGFLITIIHGDNRQFIELRLILTTNLQVQILTALSITFLGFASLYSVRYVNLRYQELKHYIFDDPETKYFRPESIKKFSPEDKKRKIKPVDLIYLVHLLILAVSNTVIFSASGWCNVILSWIFLIIAFIMIRYVFLPDLNLSKHNQETTKSDNKKKRKNKQKK